MKRYASQSRTNVLHSTSISPLIIRKQRQTTLNSKTSFHRPNIKTNQLIEKKNNDRSNQQSQLTNRDINNKSQIITYTTVIQPTRNKLTSNTPSTARSASFSFPKEYQLNDNQLNRLYQLTLEQMHQLCIRYPDKTDDETKKICNDILENWNKYRTSLGEFWLTKLDTKKRQSIIKIVWNNVQKIMKQLWNGEDLVEHLSLSKHLAKLEQRLLINNGQYLWDICQKKHKYFILKICFLFFFYFYFIYIFKFIGIIINNKYKSFISN